MTEPFLDEGGVGPAIRLRPLVDRDLSATATAEDAPATATVARREFKEDRGDFGGSA